MAAPVDVPSDDQWHVRVGNEVKVLTLEQLDDLFRLEIIDSETKVWQAGMPEWLPLSVVAGMDEPAEAAPPPAAPAPPPPPAPAPKFAGNKTQVGLGPKPGVAAAAPSDLPQPPVVVPSVTKQTLPFGASNGALSSPFAPAPSALPQPQPPSPPSTRTPPRPNGPASSRPPPPSAANGARHAPRPEVVAAPSAPPPPPPPPSLPPARVATAAMPATPAPSSLPAPPPQVPSGPPPQPIDPNALLRAYSPASVPLSAPVAAVEQFAVARPIAPKKRGLGIVARAGLVLLGMGATLLTLQRNDLLGASARSLFGAPSPETPHGVRAFLSSLPPLASPESLKPKPLPPRAAEPRADAEPRTAQPAHPAGPSKATSTKSKKPAKSGKAKSNKGK
jgi:hypothetical protein